MTDVVELQSQLDFQATQALHAQLLSLRGQPVALAAARVSFVGALFAQLLLAAERQWAQDGVAFAVTGASDGFVEGLVRLGIDPERLGQGSAA